MEIDLRRQRLVRAQQAIVRRTEGVIDHDAGFREWEYKQ